VPTESSLTSSGSLELLGRVETFDVQHRKLSVNGHAVAATPRTRYRTLELPIGSSDFWRALRQGCGVEVHGENHADGLRAEVIVLRRRS
jgi:hypothetical protein